MKKPKKDLITYVEINFMYSKETKYTTEGWMLKIVNKGWRSHKSFLMSEYYKPDKLSLDRIKRRVPSGVDKHQWITLLGTWCQEQHVKTCYRNSEDGKQQRHPHTTGRKSHARLKGDVNNKGPVSKIDLWDEAHKKKDGKYTNENVQQLMLVRSWQFFRGRGELSPEDYDKVFDDVIAKESTIGGYYDEKYWGNAKLCQGLTFVQGSSSEVRVQKELQEMKDDLKRVTGCMERMYAFMARNHPDEDWLKEVMAPGNEIKNGGQPEEEPAPRLWYNNESVNVISNKVGAVHEVDGVEEPMDNVHTTESDPKETQFENNPTSKDPVNRTGKASTMKESSEQTSHRVNISKRANNVVIHQKVTETTKSNEVVQTLTKNTKSTRAVEDKIHSQNSAHEQRFLKASEMKEILEHKTAQ